MGHKLTNISLGWGKFSPKIKLDLDQSTHYFVIEQDRTGLDSLFCSMLPRNPERIFPLHHQIRRLPLKPEAEN